MKFSYFLTIAYLLLCLGPVCSAQGNAKPEDRTTAVLRAFNTHDIVIFGEIHGNKQEYAWLRSLVSTPEFADLVDDLVVEYGISLYQNSVDRKETEGRLTIEGFSASFISQMESRDAEAPQFSRPQPAPPPPRPPKNIGAPLPPRPPSQK